MAPHILQPPGGVHLHKYVYHVAQPRAKSGQRWQARTYPFFRVSINRSYCSLYRRTAALLTLAAVSVKLSAATAPSTNFSFAYYYYRVDGGVEGGDGVVAAVIEWAKFVSEGLALDLLVEHFEGIMSALTCL